MTPESVARVRSSFNEISVKPRALAERFYRELFQDAPHLRHLFPADMTSLQGHFEAALALVVRNLEDISVLQDSLRDLGAAHVRWGAKPEDYALVRDALVRAIRSSSAAWDPALETDWRHAITLIAVPMLQGAAVHTAVVAEHLSETVDASPELASGLGAVDDRSNS
jgi:nitric oxide dioxygenase